MRDFSAEMAGNCLQKSRLFDRLGKVLVATSLQAPPGALCGSVGRQREDGYRMRMRFRFPLADGASGFQPAHHGHLQIHQHQMRMPGNHFLDADLAILGEVELEAAAFEIGLNQQDIDLRNLPQSGCGRPAVASMLPPAESRSRPRWQTSGTFNLLSGR